MGKGSWNKGKTNTTNPPSPDDTGSPLRPDRVNRSFRIAKSGESIGTDESTEFFNLLALLVGTLALVMKSRILAWSSSIALVIYLANSRREAWTFSNLATIVPLVFLSLSMSYIGPAAELYA